MKCQVRRCSCPRRHVCSNSAHHCEARQAAEASDQGAQQSTSRDLLPVTLGVFRAKKRGRW